MPRYEEVYDTDLMVATRRIIFERCNFVQSTQLTVAVVAGATALPLVDTSMVMPGDILDFPASDGHPKHQAVVDHRYNGTDNPVPLAVNAQSGSQSTVDQDWPQDTWVTRGLFLGVPPDVENLLNGENTVLYIESFQDETAIASEQYETTAYMMRVQYLRRMVQPEGQPGTIGTSMVSWSLAQQWITRLHMIQIRNAIARNPRLVTGDGKEWAIRLGDAMNPGGNWFRTTYIQNPITVDLQDFGATGEFAVMPKRLPLDPYSRGQ